ncbi:MAG: NlpC/P60 family protein, partial [Syntrophomonas sp.]
ICLLLFPCLTLLLAASIMASNQAVFKNDNAVMYNYLQHAQKGQVGFGDTNVAGNRISFAGLEPGDILLGGYRDCAYGRFSHAGIYIGNGQVIEGYVDLGVTIQPVTHYWNYSQICLLKVVAKPEVKRKAVEYAKSYQQALFFPVSFKNGERIWNCSKIMWKAYAAQGLELLKNDDDFWIAPEAYYYSPVVEVIREEGR